MFLQIGNSGICVLLISVSYTHLWTAADKKKVIVDELKEYNVLLDAVREKRPDLLNADIFDIICHVAFDKQPLTRKERANNVKKRDYLSRYEGVAKQVLEALLDKYADKMCIRDRDEIGKLHPNNVKGILDFANCRNILLVNSSPTTYNVEDYRYTYLLSKDGRSNTQVVPLLTYNKIEK